MRWQGATGSPALRDGNPKGRGKPSALRPEGYAAENGAPHVAAVTLQRACATGRVMGVSSFFGLAAPRVNFLTVIHREHATVR